MNPDISKMTPEQYLECLEMTQEEEDQLWADWLVWAEACDMAAMEQYMEEKNDHRRS